MGNNRLDALILMYVHENILDDINLSDVSNNFADREDSSKVNI